MIDWLGCNDILEKYGGCCKRCLDRQKVIGHLKLYRSFKILYEVLSNLYRFDCLQLSKFTNQDDSESKSKNNSKSAKLF